MTAKIPEGYEVLSKDDIDSVYSAMQKKGARLPKCEICGVERWIISPIIMSPVIMLRNKAKKSLKKGEEQSINQISFACDNCGNTKYLELHFLGIELSVEAEG